MDNAIKLIVLKETGASRILEIQLIQELWSGYGELNRIILDNTSVIIKLIKFPKQSSELDLGHERKKRSYEVEKKWYQNFSSPAGAILPQLITSGRSGDFQYLILEDLLVQHYKIKSSLEWNQIECCLTWLANFHRSFMAIDPHGLWPVGTYWHLATRPEELERVNDSRLKAAAPLIDDKLNRAKYQTIVHGDAKLSNFLFNEQSAAAVDFQYVGGGVGVKDLAYFLSSIYNEEELKRYEEQCLDFYFEKLGLPNAEIEWRELYPYAWCDFYRFLEGWSPGHWKINDYSKKMKERVLQCL